MSARKSTDDHIMEMCRENLQKQALKIIELFEVVKQWKVVIDCREQYKHTGDGLEFYNASYELAVDMTEEVLK